MKKFLSLLFVPLLIVISGCATRVSTGYDTDYGHHSNVSVGVHGHGSGAGVVGALIIGGIIGSIITESKNEQENKQAEENANKEREKASDELVNGYPIGKSRSTIETEHQAANDYESAMATKQSEIQWYQYGKDGNCYLMGIEQGVTDVISAVPDKQCQQ